MGGSLHLLFEELRQGGDLTGHDGSKTASDLVHDQNPTKRKKKILGEGGNNWPLQVRESPLRHVMFPLWESPTAPCDVPTVTQDQTTGQARVVETSVEEE